MPVELFPQAWEQLFLRFPVGDGKPYPVHRKCSHRAAAMIRDMESMRLLPLTQRGADFLETACYAVISIRFPSGSRNTAS